MIRKPQLSHGILHVNRALDHPSERENKKYPQIERHKDKRGRKKKYKQKILTDGKRGRKNRKIDFERGVENTGENVKEKR